jgi:hypothetical protein
MSFALPEAGITIKSVNENNNHLHGFGKQNHGTPNRE